MGPGTPLWMLLYGSHATIIQDPPSHLASHPYYRISVVTSFCYEDFEDFGGLCPTENVILLYAVIHFVVFFCAYKNSRQCHCNVALYAVPRLPGDAIQCIQQGEKGGKRLRSSSSGGITGLAKPERKRRER